MFVSSFFIFLSLLYMVFFLLKVLSWGISYLKKTRIWRLFLYVLVSYNGVKDTYFLFYKSLVFICDSLFVADVIVI